MSVKTPVYLDNNSTTQLDPSVLEYMMPYFLAYYGNPASKSHKYGWIAEESVSLARNKIANFIGCSPKEIFFTSGATESNNLALRGIAEAYLKKGNHIISSPTEHKSVIDTLDYLSKSGFEINYLNVDEYGIVDPNELKKSIKENTILVSIMYTNNETGNFQPVKQISEICSEKNVLFHTDSTQAIGKIPFKVNDTGADLISISSHKFYGPKGIGALFIRNKNPKIRVIPQITGGGHEGGLRSGTLNVPAIVGFGKACEISEANIGDENLRLKNFTNKMLNSFRDAKIGLTLNSNPKNRLPNTLNISFDNIDSAAFMSEAKGIAVSSGSACTSASLEPSYVLTASGKTTESARSSVRFSLGRFTTEEETDFAIEVVIKSIKKLSKENEI